MDIAIVGISGKFPLAENTEDFYENLRSGVDCVRDISSKRISDTTIVEKKYRKLAFIEDIDKFDYNFFGYSLGEAELMDPHQRIALEVIFHAIENAGYSLSDLDGSKTSLYFSSPELNYHEHFENFIPAALLGNVTGVTPGVISRFFNFIGPATFINTTCSSSLVAVHYACNDLINRQCDYSMVCAVNLSLFPFENELIPNVGISAPDGKAKAFDERADGTGGGEFVGCVLLKPLEKAMTDHDLIHAVVKGSAINQDGKRSPFLASPSKIAQEEVIKAAWDNAGVSADSIGYLEAHGTGTKIGDPIEVDAINNAFAAQTTKKQFCRISSIKTNIGHANMAAGIAGLLKSVLSLKHREFFPSLHFKRPNPFIEFEKGAVFVNDQLKPWNSPVGKPRRCGVSAFGLCGTNAHVVLEEGPVPFIIPQKDSKEYFFPVSAVTNDALKNNIQSLVDFLEHQPNISLGCLSYTLFARSRFNYRVGFIASDRESLLGKLKDALEVDYIKITHSDAPEVKVLVGAQVHYNEDVIARLRRELKVYDNTYRLFETKICETCTQNNDSVSTYVHLCCICKVLSSLGIEIQSYYGSDIGAIVVKTLNGTLTESDGLKLAAAHNESAVLTNIEEMIVQTVDELTESHVLVLSDDGNYVHEVNFNSSTTITPIKVESRTSLLDLVDKFYQLGANLHWKNIFFCDDVYTIELPAYSFDKTRAWIKEKTVKEHSFDYYRLQWKKSPLLVTEPQYPLSVVIFDNVNNGSELLQIELTRQGHQCVIIPFSSKSNSNGVKSSPNFTYDPEDIIKAFQENQFDTIIYLSSINNISEIDNEIDPDNGLTDMHQLFHLFKTLEKLPDPEVMNFISVTFKGRKILEDNYVNPYLATIHGFMLSLEKELSWLRMKCLDIDFFHSESLQVMSKELINEGESSGFIGYRNNTRYIMSVEPKPKASENDNLGRLLSSCDNLLITGGASGIGLELVKQLSFKGKYNFLIVGRRSLSIENKDCEQKSKVHNIFSEVEKRGCKIVYKQLDISDLVALKKAYDEFARTYGNIKGIIHSAGLAGNATFSQHTWDTFKAPLLPKIHGTVNILNLVKGSHDCNFVVLFSGLAAYVGATGNTNYSAANIFLDNVIYNFNKKEGRTKAWTVSWAAWRETGMYSRWKKSLSSANMSAEEDFTLSNEEGVEAFWGLPITDDPLSLVYEKGYAQFQGGYSREVKAINPSVDLHRPQVKMTIDELQDVLANAWKKILKSSDIDYETDFFELGSTSLHFTSIINEISDQLGVDLEFYEVDENATIKELAAYIQNLIPDDEQIKQELMPIESQEYYTPSYQQLGILAQEATHNSLTAYNMAGSFKLTGPLNQHALEISLERLFREHEVLRSVFKWINHVPKVIFISLADFDGKLRVHDLCESQPDSPVVKELIDTVVKSPFNLSVDPLVRVQLIKLEQNKHVFTICFHHLIGDAWSIEILANELIKNYREFLYDEKPTISTRDIQYKDYVASQLVQKESGYFTTSKEYWLGILKKDCPPLLLPMKIDRPKFKTYNGHSVVCQIPQEVLPFLVKLKKRFDTTDFVIFTSLTYILLFRYTGQEDIVTGTRTAGRNDKKLEDQIGFYVNTFILRLNISPDDSLYVIVNKLKSYLADSFKYQYYPFNKLIGDVSLKRDISRSPLFDVLIEMINIEGVVSENEQLQDLHINSIPLETNTSKYDLCFRFKESKEGSFLVLEYNTDLFDSEFIETTIARFNLILDQSIRFPEKAIQEIDFINNISSPVDDTLDDIFNQNF